MHKAMTIIQMKLEGQLLQRHPEYRMNHLQWLKQINFSDYTVTYLNNKYVLNDHDFPIIHFSSPLELSLQEEQLMKALEASFSHSQKLHTHIQFLYRNGSMYKTINNNLLFHGCIPMNEDGTLREILVNHNQRGGKALLDDFVKIANDAYFLKDREASDYMWYLWCSKDSPLFGKSKLSIFEKYFIDDKTIHQETLDPYYYWIEQAQTCQMILKHFQLKEDSHIINGHVPVKTKEGEKPVKAEGRLYVIDGGISKAYQPKTGIAGYTLIYDSQHLQIAKHQPYDALAKDGLLCLTPQVEIIETKSRIKNRDCDIGEILQTQINDLHELLAAYRNGLIKENFKKS